jgi:membrane protease YdiL (CAAX protease family)
MAEVAEVRAQAVSLPSTKARLWAEMLLVFVGLPVVCILFRRDVIGMVVPLLLVAGLFSWLWLKRQPGYDLRRLWIGPAFSRHILPRVALFVPLGILLTGLSYWILPDSFLVFPRYTPLIWALVMVLYPVLSAYPQELVFRACFFERYRPLFTSDFAMILASAVFFGFAHAFLGNWIAPVLAGIGGILFGRTYLRSGSLLIASLEHGLYGDLLFTLGMGWFFYAGSIH